MATKTISVRLEAYDRLKRAKRDATESFSDVIMRARWPGTGVTGRELLDLYERHGPFFSEATLDRVEGGKAADVPPEDKWATG